VQKVKAILLDPANPDSFNGVVRQAKSDKIPVVGVGSPIVASNVEADGAASSSHCNIGHELAKGAKTLLPNGGTLAIDMLQRFPNVDLLYGADDTYGVGAARAAQGAQKCGKAKVLFAVLGETAEEMMRAGCADYVVAQQPVLIGRIGLQMADKLIKGQPLAKKLEEISLIPVTKANLDSINKATMQAPKGWTP
jgi:ABC-type sugar transport system substrate-binding protein